MKESGWVPITPPRSGVAVTRVAPFLCRPLCARESNARGQIPPEHNLRRTRKKNEARRSEHSVLPRQTLPRYDGLRLAPHARRKGSECRRTSLPPLLRRSPTHLTHPQCTALELAQPRPGSGSSGSSVLSPRAQEPGPAAGLWCPFSRERATAVVLGVYRGTHYPVQCALLKYSRRRYNKNFVFIYWNRNFRSAHCSYRVYRVA